MDSSPLMPTTGKLTGSLFTECAEWIWEQLHEEGFMMAGELVELVLATERELGVHTRPLEEIAQVLADEFRLRGIAGNPQQIEPALILEVLRWEDDFLGFAGISREDS
jgi:hypothetical protein